MADTQTPTPAANQSATPTPCWSSIVKSTQNNQGQQAQPTASAAQVFVDSCKLTKGIAVAIVDANAIIEGGEKLSRCADRFVSVPEVLAEVRDPMSRHRLAVMPFSIDTMEPSPESLRKVIKFARATGDLQTLSDVDLKLIALTYTLEAQIHGTKHLRECPPPVQLVNVKRLPEKDLPGWGNNVPNLEEWEALENEATDESNINSRILPLKDLSLNVVPQDNHSENGSIDNRSEAYSENHEDSEAGVRKPKRYPPKKTEIKIEGKKMVADGIDASQGQHDDDGGDWRPAVSRSTHRRYLRRKARREFESLSEKDGQQDEEESVEHGSVEAGQDVVQKSNESSQAHSDSGVNQNTEITEDADATGTVSSILREMRDEEESSKTLQEKMVNDSSVENNPQKVDDTTENHTGVSVENNEVDMINGGMDQLDISSETNESVDVSCADDDCSEQSWMLRSLSESSVACITSDFAMQNVLLQMGLRLLAPGGMQIRQLTRWILKCHACSTVTAEIGRIFCPRCGNAGTLRKVAVTVNENGIVLAARRPRITLRGTKFSLPLPQGGREAITKNLILREDQLPQKFLHPKTKKKANKEEDDFFMADNIFGDRTDKRSPLRPPVRQALAVFSGKRNPNDNHFSRSKHK